MNDVERSQWIDNDEGLYRAWKRSRLNKLRWMKENREFIDKVIENVTNSAQPAHYLTYPGKGHGKW